jgi:branched-chain amino acid aminotransferase
LKGTLGVAQSESALLFTILCPVGNYFAEGSESVSLLADPSYTRAWPGGCGDRKMGSNYGPTIRVQSTASSKGRQQVLWLYGPEHQLTEVGTMNIFVFYIDNNGGRCARVLQPRYYMTLFVDKVLTTPPLNGLILPGVTRHSILQMTSEWDGIRIEERIFTMGEIMQLLRTDRVLPKFFLFVF